MKKLLFLLIFTPSFLFSQNEMFDFTFGSSYEMVYQQLKESYKDYNSGPMVGKDGKKLTAKMIDYGFIFSYNWEFEFHWVGEKSYLNKIKVYDITSEYHMMKTLDSLRNYYTFSPLHKEGNICSYSGSGKKNSRDSKMFIWYGKKENDDYAYELTLEYKNLPQSLNAQEQCELGLAAEKLWNPDDASTKKFFYEAIEWWKKSDASGNPIASYNLGFYNYSGGIGKKNYSEAVRLLNKSLQNADTITAAGAYTYLGYCYDEGGNGIQKDQKKAFDYFQKGYKMRSVKCAHALAVYYAEGIGCEKNLKKACEFSDILFFRVSRNDYAEIFIANRNQLAYEYAAKQQYALALETIDLVITHLEKWYLKIGNMERTWITSEEKVRLAEVYDSKGEFYLMMGREADALTMWNKVKEFGKDNWEFFQNNSELYKYMKAKGKL